MGQGVNTGVIPLSCPVAEFVLLGSDAACRSVPAPAPSGHPCTHPCTMQVCTGVMIHGYEHVHSLCGGLQQFMQVGGAGGQGSMCTACAAASSSSCR